MIIELKKLSAVLSQISDITSGTKNIPGIMFNIKDSVIQVCYSDGNNVFMREVDAITSEEDIKDKIVFNYKALTTIVEACKPTGSIVTDTIELNFKENQKIIVRAEKKLPVVKNGEESEKIVSVIEQELGWVKADSGIKVAVLNRANYDSLLHFDESVIAENYAEAVVKPTLTGEWEVQRDEWEIDVMKSVLSKLAIENGKTVYVAPTARRAFVENTSCVICIPLDNEIKHRVIQSSANAKTIASVIGKLETEDGKIYTHMMDNDTLVFSTDDNKFAYSIKNAKQVNSNIIQVNTCVAKDFSQHMMIFNKEVLQSCLNAAKIACASEKIDVAFEYAEGDYGKTVAKMVLTAKNTASSTSNTYDIISDYLLDPNEGLKDMKVSVPLELVLQAVSKTESNSVVFEISADEGGTKTVRIAEINTEKRQQISEDNGVEGPWSPEFMAAHRSEMLGYTTYFSVNVGK